MRTALKGFTLIEILLVVSILSLLAQLAFPVWQKSNAQMILAKEQQKLYLFLRRIQARVENSSNIWLIIANQNASGNKWCFTAQIKDDYVCDCFSPALCPKQVAAQFYTPYFPEKTTIISKQYYPFEITKFNGIRNTALSGCFVLQADSGRTLFSFSNLGTLKLKDYPSLSACTTGNEE